MIFRNVSWVIICKDYSSDGWNQLLGGWVYYDCIETINDWVDLSEYKNFIMQVVNWDTR